MKAAFNNNNIFIVATKDILKNTLLTLVGGIIYYNKDLKKINYFNENKNNKTMQLMFFKTAKSAYDRIIKISKNSIINFLFPLNGNKENNLEIIKILNSDNLI